MPIPMRGCSAIDWSFGGDPDASVFTNIHDGKTVSVSVTFSPMRFDSVVGALGAKYGPPASDQQGEVQNRMGAKFDQREVVWKAEGLEMKASLRGSDLTESKLIITDTRAAAKVMSEVQAKTASDI